MPDIDTRPTEVDIDCYGGDTLVIHVKLPTGDWSTQVFTAQVRGSRPANRVDAQFEIRPTSSGADVVLESADCQRLSRHGLYKGFWDVQMTAPDGVVSTLAQGAFRVHPDVTRPAP